MALDEATQAELDDLIADARDRELSDAQGERLAEILRSDRDARLAYLRAVDQCASIRRYSADLSFTHDPAQQGASSMLTEALMRQRLGSGGADDEDIEKLPEAIVAEPMIETLNSRDTRRSHRGGWVAQRVLLVAMAAAIVAVAIPTIRFFTDTIGGLEVNRPVATLTAVEGAEWADTESPMLVGRSLGAGDLRLELGSAELTFASGAVVRLDAPCAFNIHDRMGGDLRYGQLSANVPAEASGFTVTGPGFAVIDRGTAFRLDVPKDGKPWVHVSEGAVDLALTNRDGTVRRSMRLTEDLSAEVDPDARQVTVTEPVAIAVASTGRGLEKNAPDSNWTVTARRLDAPQVSDATDAPDAPEKLVKPFKPGPAYVADFDRAWIKRTPDDPARWITVKPKNPAVAGSSVHTFATRFDLTGLDPDTVKLRMRFIVDNHLAELRVNGLAVDVPKHHDDAPFETFTEMTLRHVFLDGENTLEFDVRNILPTDQFSPMGLLVELRGSAHRRTRIDVRSGDAR